MGALPSRQAEVPAQVVGRPEGEEAVRGDLAEGDPYYPIPRDDTRALYRRYQALADELPGVTFVGRLARYQYLNMDQVVGQALSAANKLLAEPPERR